MADAIPRDERERLQADAVDGEEPRAETSGPVSVLPAAQPDPVFDLFLRDLASTSGTPTARLPALGEVIAGKYRIEERLGGGGMGAVFRATHLISEKQVAVKWMLRPASDEQTRRRFVREARAAARIDHPNVVDVYDAGQQGDLGLYMVMQLLRGETLSTRIKRGPLTVDEAIELLVPAMRGVSAVHRAGIIHRDLKPDNIFLCEDRHTRGLQAKVLDFGISAMTVSDPGDPTLTRDGAALGTPAYMSPEQLRDSRTVDVRADVYAFGVILYEALTGQLPFVADSYNGLVLAIVHGAPCRLRELRPDLSPELEEIVLTAMARRCEDRYASMDILISALLSKQGARRRSTESSPPVRSAPSMQPAPKLAPRRPRWRWAAALAAVLGVFVLAGWSVRRLGLGPLESSARSAAPRPPTLPSALPGVEPAKVLAEPAPTAPVSAPVAQEPQRTPPPELGVLPSEQPLRQGRIMKPRRTKARSGTISADEL